MRHTLRTRTLLALLLASACATTAGAGPTTCRWDNPGANRSLVPAAEAIMRLAEIPLSERRTLADMAGAGGKPRHSWRQVTVTRDQIDGGRYIELRNMNWGAQGRICVGPVDRSRWPASEVQRALLYQVGPWAVLVFSACGNVALATDTWQPLPPGPPQPRRHWPWHADLASLGTADFWLMPLATGPGSGARPAPEPGTLALLAAAAAAAWAARTLGVRRG